MRNRLFTALAIFFLFSALTPTLAAGPGADTSGFTSQSPLDRDSEYFISLNPNKGVSGVSEYYGVGFTGSELNQPFSHIHVLKKLSNGGIGNLHLCDGISDPTCQPKDWDGVSIFSVLGNCAVDFNGGCVRSMSLALPSGKVIEARPLNSIPKGLVGIRGQAPTQGINGFPAGHSTWIWRAEGVDSGGPSDFLLSGVVNSGGTSNLAINGQWNVRPESFRFEVFPITREESSLLKSPAVREYTEPSGRINVGAPIQQYCLAVDEGVCFHRGVFPEGAKFKVALELPRSITGWLNGRLRDPIVSVTSVNSNFDRLEIEAMPGDDILGGGWVQKSSISTSDWSWRDSISGMSAAKSFSGQMIAAQNSVFVGNSGDTGALEWFRSWEKKIGVKALRMTKSWSIASTRGTSSGGCLASSSGISGIISTNATVYEPGAPIINGAGTTLSYRVGGPLQDPGGKDLLGTYSMSLSHKLLECLYRITEIPSQVQIGIVGTAGDRKVQSATLTNRDGWANFSAAGFSFGDTAFLEVSVNRQPVAMPTPTPAPSGVSQSSASEATEGERVKSSVIKCVKGKKIITSSNLKCPKGFTKKR